MDVEQLGAHFGETSILTAAGIVFAAMAGPLTAMEGGLGTHLLEYDFCSPSLQFDDQAGITGLAELLSSQAQRGFERHNQKKASLYEKHR